MRALFALALLLAACKCPVCPVCPAPADMSSARDMASAADLSVAPDLSVPPDLSCIRCDAVLNPCPALGLYCDPVLRCCTSTPH